MNGAMHDDPTDPDEALAIAEHFQGEWYNGGLPQFFANWEPEDAALVPAALRTIGFSQGGDIVAKAITAMGPQAEWQAAGLGVLTNDGSHLREVLYALDLAFDQVSSAFDQAIVDFEDQRARASGEEMFE